MTSEVDLFGYLESIRLRFEQLPVVVFLGFAKDGEWHDFRFVNAEPLSAFLSVFDEFWRVRIVDQNQEQATWLEFGRYRIEIWDEDNPISQATADRFSHTRCTSKKSSAESEE